MFNCPVDVIQAHLCAINEGNEVGLGACYEDAAVCMIDIEMPVRGRDAIVAAHLPYLDKSTQLVSLGQMIEESDGIAMCVQRLAVQDARQPGQSALAFVTVCKILRQQANGEWLVAIDKPWGAWESAGDIDSEDGLWSHRRFEARVGKDRGTR
ncbi:YybH family protein [Burkholderia ubonensis]|uniref:YybH family protein n=1 Tax=Burkholderia ubonensis TaxID=101571 RepID=UPI000B237767|nr:hypothetical protein [Burkholderia ubonensis]